MNNKVLMLGLALATFWSGGAAWAEKPVQANKGEQSQAQGQPAAGRDMMTREERQEHRTRMRSTATKEEREQVRAEQHEKMKRRAKEQGKTIPERPPAGGMGSGMGSGMRGGGGR